MKAMNKVLCALAVLLALALFGCSAANSQMQNAANDGSNLSEAAATSAAAPTTEQDKSGTSTSDGSSLPVIDPGNVANSGKKIIYNVEMSIETKDAAAAINDITSTVASLGGYISDSQYVEESRNTASTITVRIAPDKLNELTKHIGALGKVISQSMGSQDVTDQYYDVQAHLTNAQAQEAQLLGIMKQATKVDDILKVRAELNTVQQEIEQYKGQIRLMDNQVGYSTVKITIQQPVPPAVVVEDKPKSVQFWGFAAVWQKISLGLADSFNWTLNAISAVLIVLAKILVPLLFVALVVGVILLIIKLAIKGQKKR